MPGGVELGGVELGGVELGVEFELLGATSVGVAAVVEPAEVAGAAGRSAAGILGSLTGDLPILATKA